MIREREPADRERINRLLIIFITLLSAEVVNLDHFGVVHLEESLQILFLVSKQSFEAFSWESTCNNAVGDVRQVQVEVSRDCAVLVRRHYLTNSV